MIKITSFTPLPNTIIDDYLSKGKMTSQEFVVLSVLYRKTYGWHKERERIKNKDLAQLCNIPESSCRKAAASLNEKDLIDILYICPECESLVEYDASDYQCGKCQTKTTPYKVYEPKIEEIETETLFDKNTPPPVQTDTPPAHSEQPPCSHIAAPLLTHSRVTASKPLSDNVSQPPKQTLLKETLLNKSKTSSSKGYTKEDQEQILEISPADEDEIFSKESEEEEAEILARRIIENQYSDYFSAGNLPEIKRQWLIDIGKKEPEEIKDALLNVATSLKNPAKLIEFMHNRLYKPKVTDPVPIEAITDISKLESLFNGVSNADNMWRILKQVAKLSAEMTPVDIYNAAYKEIDILDADKSLEWFEEYCNA